MGGLEVDHQLDLGRCLHHEQANTNANLSKPELGYEVTVVKDATADLLGRDDTRRARHQPAELRQRYCHDKGSHRLYFFSLSPPSQVQRGRDGGIRPDRAH
jgi:hypothetical protein